MCNTPVKGTHHAQAAGFDARLELRHEPATQRSGSKSKHGAQQQRGWRRSRRRPVAQGDVGAHGLAQRVRPAVHDEVLAAGRRRHVLGVVALQALHELPRERAGEDRALAVGFVVAAPGL